MKEHIVITRMNRSSWFKLTWKGMIIHIDPGYAGVYENQGIIEEDFMMKADIILISHHHKDHLRTELIDRLCNDSTVIIAPSICQNDLNKPFYAIQPNETYHHSLFSILAVDAYNTPTGRSIRKFHQKGDFVGYIVTLGKTRVYFAGDTDVIDEMNEFHRIDVAMLPIGGTYVMDLEEAVEAVGIIKPKVVIPMHQADANLQAFQSKIKDAYGIDAIILHNGDSYTVIVEV